MAVGRHNGNGCYPGDIGSRPALGAGSLRPARGRHRGDQKLARVTPVLYRSGQPSPEQFKALHDMGIKTVINLQRARKDEDRAAAEAANLRYIQIKMSPLTLNDEQVFRFLRAVQDPANQPALVYCLVGSDRSGVVIGAYRIVVQGWSRAAAIRELKDFGFWPIYFKIPIYLRHFDVAAMRARLGITAPPTASVVTGW